MEAALGEILLLLYRLVRGVPPAQFKDDALEIVKRHLPFERAQWGTLVRANDDWAVQSYHLHHLPDRKHREWLALRHRVARSLVQL